MRTRRGHFHGALGALLTFDVGKIEREGKRFFLSGRNRRGQPSPPHEKGHSLIQGARGKNRQTFHHSGLTAVFGRRDEPARLFVSSQQGKGKHAGNRLEPSVQRELGRREPSFEGFCGNDAGGGQKAERQRKIVGRAFLAPVGRRKIHRDACGGQFEAGILQSLENAFSRFAYSAFGKPHHNKGRHALPAAVHLQIDSVGIDAVERSAGKPNYHIRLTC